MTEINNKDPFEQIVKSKLADYNAEVPSLGWEKLEGSLLAAQKLKVVRTRWIASTLTAVAAALIGVFFVFQNMNNETPMNVSEIQSPKTTSINKEYNKETTTIKKDEVMKEVVKKKTSHSSLIAENTSSTQDKDFVSFSKSDEVRASEAIASDNKEVSEDKTLDEPRNGNKDNDVDEETKQRLIQEFINEGKRPLVTSEATKTFKTKTRSRNSISLTTQSGLSGSQQNSTTPNTLRASLSDSYGTFAINKMKANNKEVEIQPKSEINHSQPVSFGVLTSFALSRKFQIETGLIYTYLSSETKSKSADYNENEKVQFHYLGVPLNLNYTLFSINKLDMFVSAGAMIEKDISGRIKYNDEKKVSSFNSGYASEKSSKIKQNNPQFSISSGLGITYPIYDKANLFGKIGGRYYINANNEYRTYYSDEKFGLDIQLGIKFNF